MSEEENRLEVDIMEKVKCPVCGCTDAERYANSAPVTFFYICPVCGRYEYTEDEITNPSLNKNKLGSYLYYNGFRNRGDSSAHKYHTTLAKEKCDEYVSEFKNGNTDFGHPVHMDNDIIDAWYPRSFVEKINMILMKLDDISEYVGQEIKISKYELYGLTFVERYIRNSEDVMEENEIVQQATFFTKYLNDVEYIKGGLTISGDQTRPLSITPKGYQLIDQLQRDTGKGRDVLVAMKFGDDTLNLREAIKMGIRDAGYNPILIDEVEHNELITPELLSHIKNSKFVVVDLTHENNGAYFEEGYAMGLGKPVIQLCNKNTKLHFDIAQKNTIMWETESDIPLRLKNRIKATID